MRPPVFLLPLAGLLTVGLAGAAAPPAEGPQLAAQARRILEQNCYRCHGQNGSNEGGFSHILDFQRVRARRWLPATPRNHACIAGWASAATCRRRRRTTPQ